MASLEPEPDRDQLTQAVTVGLCVALAGVLMRPRSNLACRRPWFNRPKGVRPPF